jgi:hypothetical protein
MIQRDAFCCHCDRSVRHDVAKQNDLCYIKGMRTDLVPAPRDFRASKHSLYICPYCPYKTGRKTSMTRHLLLKHNDSYTPPMVEASENISF